MIRSDDAMLIVKARHAMRHGVPTCHLGYTVDPQRIVHPEQRRKYQTELRDWYLALTDRTRNLLGEFWAELCDPSPYAPSNRQPTDKE